MSWKIVVASQLMLMALVCNGQASASAPCIAPPTGLVSWWTGDADETDLYGVNNPSAVNAVTLGTAAAPTTSGLPIAAAGPAGLPEIVSTAVFTWLTC